MQNYIIKNWTERRSWIFFLHAVGATVNDIIEKSGAEKLRIYSILFEESQAGHVEFIDEEYFGAPKSVRLIREK